MMAYIRIYDDDGNYVASNDFSNSSDDLNLKWAMPLF
jgi:hypothetical protein